MTIRGNGGVFGRNPTFNNVSSETVDTNLLDVDNVRIDGNTVSTTNTNGNLLLTPNGSGLTRTDKLGINTSTAITSSLVSIYQGSLFFFGPAVAIKDGAASLDGRFIRFENESGAEIGYVKRNGASNIALGVGNGGGIDFSATAGTGTSELFDDYEEGTWTPVIADATTGGNVGTGSAAGFYTKIGDMVYIQGYVINANTTGMTAANQLYVRGLPFPANAASFFRFGGSIITTDTSFSQYLVPWVNAGESAFRISDVNVGNILVSGLTSGSADMFFNISYKA